jgi:Tfp pilus assembly protein PilP
MIRSPGGGRWPVAPLPTVLIVTLAGCGRDRSELRQWMDDQVKTMKGKVELLPVVRCTCPSPITLSTFPIPSAEKIEPARVPAARS